MIYAILAYHDESIVTSWSAEEDAALMEELHGVHRRLTDQGRLGPAARLAPTDQAVTIRRSGRPIVLDGPFAETKEQLLGFYLVDSPDLDGAVAAAEDLARVNTSAVYEIRPVMVYLPGAALPGDALPGI